MIIEKKAETVLWNQGFPGQTLELGDRSIYWSYLFDVYLTCFLLQEVGLTVASYLLHNSLSQTKLINSKYGRSFILLRQ